MEKEIFDKKTIQEAQLKLAEKRAKQNELDSIKGSVKMISDALILLNNKMETLKNTNLKNIEESIVNFEEITDYHNKKIDNYDNNFNLIKRKINSFNDVAADILSKIKGVCETLEVESIQELSKETEEYANTIKNKIQEISSEFDSFDDVRIKVEQINEQISNIEKFNISSNINALTQAIQRIQDFTDVFEGNIAILESKVNDDRLVDKANKKIKSFDKVYDSVDSILDKTGAISENIKVAENTVKSICEYNEKQNNNIEEIIQNKFSLLSQIILEISEKVLDEKNQVESFVNKKYDDMHESINKISSAHESNTDNIIENIKSTVNDSNILIEKNIKGIVDSNNDDLIKNINKSLDDKFAENTNIASEFRKDLKLRHDTLDSLINEIKNDLLTNSDTIKDIIASNYEEMTETINNMNKSQDETINKISELLIENFKDVLERIHDTVYKNEKKYSSIIEKVEQLSESVNILNKDIGENLERHFTEVYDKLKYLTDQNEELNKKEEERYKDINEKIEKLYVEIPQKINADFKEVFLELDNRLNNMFDNQYKKIEQSIEKINDNIIEKDEFNNKFEKINKLDDKICDLEQKLNNLLEENKSLKESIRNNNQIINQRVGSNIGQGVQTAGINNSINILEKAASNGDIKACLQLGDMYYQGINVNQDLEKALKYYEIGSRSGSAECNFKILGIYKVLADKGIVKYQFLMGKSYLEGKIVKQDLDTALIWYKKAALNGHMEAKAVLIRMYKMMANNNNPDGLYNLGMCYYEGFCIEKDLAKAYEYLNKAASLGHGDAIRMVSANR